MKRLYAVLALVISIALACPIALLCVRSAYPRPFRDAVGKSGLEERLVYAVIKTESDFRTDAVSRAGAVGLMQIKPSTAEFICKREGIPFDAEKLKDGAYNISLGCGYLRYLLGKFSDEETALAAYNAGEGTVRDWLSREDCSSDGVTLDRIPYGETQSYLKKVGKFRKIYEFLYR